MSAGQTFVIAVAAIALVAAAAVFTVAFRRDGGRRAVPLDRHARSREERRLREQVTREAASAATESAAVLVETEVEPVPDPLTERPEISSDEFGVNRRQFFNRAILGVFGIFLAQFALGFLAFFWPKLKAGGFGGKIDAGDVNDLIEQINQPDGSIVPVFVPAAQAYIVPFATDPAASSFAATPAPVIADGLMALWQRCVHLGCRVPVCLPSQGFECPCHGSKYNFHGEYEAGPAPRNLDRFAVTVSESGRLIVDTGTVIQTARSKTKTIRYPQGPSCLSAREE